MADMTPAPWSVVVCIASGPSLTAEDCAAVRRWRQADGAEARAVICTNTSFRLAPWADVLFAMDRAWWYQHMPEVKRAFAGELAALNHAAHDVVPWRIKDYRNSGAAAVALAIKRGARRVILLGYDVQYRAGLRHWHGDHPGKLGNADRVAAWPAQFEQLRRDHPAIDIINCSRETALTVFPRAQLQAMLNER